ncbi:hypothetical protein TNCV_4631031 [Trichonephila clavipes]|nr:hypothetical protein TNCV_4631031 [Trichonephila clavipes]
MIRGFQATEAPTCLTTVPLTELSFLKKCPKGVLIWGLIRTSYASVTESHFSILAPRCLQTRIRPSWCCRQMRDSPVKTTSFHSAAYILLSSHYWRRRRQWFCVKGRPSNGRLVDRPLCCKRRD